MKVIIQYPFIAKYRIPIFTLLINSESHSFEIWACKKGGIDYISTSTQDLNVKNIPLNEISFLNSKRKLEWQPKAIKYALAEAMDAYIILANPNSLSTWLCVLIAKIRKVPVLMWSHGYLKEEKGLKAYVRKAFYNLADRHLLYGNKAKIIMAQKGFNPSELYVIYNSLDYSKQKFYRDKLTYADRKETRSKYGFKENSIVLIAIGRLLKKLKLEQVIRTIKDEKYKDINLFIIGDGPEEASLQSLIKKLDVQENVIFYGACHEEKELAELYNASDYSVVMGKVGLSAMHSLAYGIPMITNHNIDEHFPEIEAIIEGETGFYFLEDNIPDFSSKLQAIEYRGKIYNNCISIIEKNYTPHRQKEIIETVINSL